MALVVKPGGLIFGWWSGVLAPLGLGIPINCPVHALRVLHSFGPWGSLRFLFSASSEAFAAKRRSTTAALPARWRGRSPQHVEGRVFGSACSPREEMRSSELVTSGHATRSSETTHPSSAVSKRVFTCHTPARPSRTAGTQCGASISSANFRPPGLPRPPVPCLLQLRGGAALRPHRA